MTTEAALEALLIEAEGAHGAYESKVLGGVYDEQWATWYARYAVDHGFDGILGHAITADALARFLAGAFADFKAAAAPGVSWSTSIARRIAAEL